MNKGWILGTALLAASAALPVAADEIRIDGRYGSIVLTDGERHSIREYYQTHTVTETRPGEKKLNRGMKKRLEKGKGLPPGWQKKISRGNVVPDDVWSQRQPIPREVIRGLPPEPEGVVTVRVDSKVIRVVAATKVILDAFDL